MRKTPNTALAAAFAASIGSIGCAGQQMEAQSTKPQDARAECDRKDIQTISAEPGRVVFKICSTTYIAETRDAAKSTMEGGDAPAKPDVQIKVCDTRDLRNWRTVSHTPTKTVSRVCDMIHTAEIHRLNVRSTVSRPVIRAEHRLVEPVAAPVTPKTPDSSEAEDKE